MKTLTVLLITVCVLNLADFITTVLAIRSGIGQEANPIFQNLPAGQVLIKLAVVPCFAGIVNITAALAEKEGSRRTVKTIKLITMLTVAWLAFVVFQNLCVIFLQGGPVDWIIRGVV